MAFESAPGQQRTVRIQLSSAGRRLLARRGTLRVIVGLTHAGSTVSRHRLVLVAR